MAIILPLISTFNAAGIKAAQGQFAALGGALKRIAGPAAVATLGLKALQGAVEFAGDAISEARDLERNMAALGTVFGNITPRMAEFSKNAYTMGLSQVEAARTSTFLGSVLKQAGLPMNEVADNTERLTILAQDLATTFGYDTSEALTAMTALFRGEYDPIEKFGVALKQQEVNALVAAKGLGKLTGQALLNAQQQVRMEELYRRSADAQGAFARQSGTLFVEQKKLTAVFSNMQATVGTELTPAITSLMQALTPLIEENAPKLQEAFRGVGLVIDALIPIVSPIITYFGNLFETIGKLLQALDPLTKLLGATLAVALELVTDLVSHILAPFNALFDAINKVFDAGNKDFGDLGITKFLRDVVNQGGVLATVLSPFVKILERIGEITNAQDINKGTRGEAARFAAMAKFYDGKAAFEKAAAAAAATGTGGDTPKDVVAEFYKDLKDEIAKESARLKLTNLGASEAFIEAVVGSGEDWKKVFASVTAKGKAGVAQLQREFNKTSAGIKELSAAYEATKKQAQDLYEEAYAAYEKLKDVYDQQVQAINDLKKALKDAGSSIAPLAVVTREIGQFEQAVIDAFTNIADTIAEGLANGTLLKDAAASLTAYAKSEQSTIQEIMRQRDVLVNKRNLAQALMDDIKSTIVGMGNVTELLAKNTTDVTETITKMVGNVQVATSKVVKGVTGGSAGLVASFKDTLAKTKEFAQQLKDLRALGLDKNIYQQIVSAGIDAGGATAKAILEGGSGTVSELNSLFQELESVGADMAEQTAQVMFGSGVDLIDGLINGLISKEQLLVDKATEMARNFNNAFNAEIAKALPMPNAPTAPNQPVFGPDPAQLGSLAQSITNASKYIVNSNSTAKELGGISKLLDYVTASENLMPTVTSTTRSVAEIEASIANATKYVANINNDLKEAGAINKLTGYQAELLAAQRTVNVTVNAGMGVDGKIVGQTIQSYINQYNKSNV